MSRIIDVIIEHIRVDLTAEFDRNFERKAFFNKKWQEVKKPNPRGSLMVRTSLLRNSISSARQGTKIVFKSSVPYAEIHNEGGTIKRTSKKGKDFTVTMPQRQFIGTSPETDKIITEIVDEHLPRSINDFFRRLFN
ncbi:phage virion morphogenesis protein [Dysgonomonas sp. GY617]|uniref:phage virion morphogenesis protein n=1 Tax=Dysgonomonas sp. GY617 TaxID=2780420 RepID=UPI001883E289|nr:phage virion morphogenesis protein [Dysgonomonas sp. GY617]MBF0576613.1 phage virion morphogenesis protein [Dysgonomonas sp. GY617]